jgi:tRNA threonylcarbamoyladenosine biosynthesis protein TsaE
MVAENALSSGLRLAAPNWAGYKAFMPQSQSSKPSGSTPYSCQLADLAATAELAGKLSALVEEGDVIALTGPIGAGKTTFARFFINATGYREDVPSPTFNLVQVYEGEGIPIWHFDLYRLERPEDVFELGIDQAFEEGVTLIEWPERMSKLLPPEALVLNFKSGASEQERQIDADVPEHWGARFADGQLFAVKRR